MGLLLGILASVSLSGKLFLVGGGGTPPDLVDAFIKESGGPNGLIVVLPLATEKPTEERGMRSVSLLEKHGAKNVYLFAKAPTPDDLRELKAKLDVSRGVWMPGGDQGWIVRHLGKAWIDAHLKPLLKRGVNFYGTSAGAMVCSDPMITGNGEEPGTATIGAGIGLTSWLIDSHFTERKREPRLRYAMEKTGAKRGLGLSERDWVVIQDDRIVETHGNPVCIERAAARRQSLPLTPYPHAGYTVRSRFPRHKRVPNPLP